MEEHRHRRCRAHGRRQVRRHARQAPATELGVTVIKELLARSGLQGEQIGEVILGQVLQAGTDRTRRARRSLNPACDRPCRR